MHLLTHFCPLSLWSPPFPLSAFCSALLLVLAHFIPHLLSAPLFCFPSLHPSMYPVSFPEQPVDNSLPISWLLTDQQLCVQLPAQMAPEPNHKLGKWGLPQMVRCLRSYVYTQLCKVHVQTHFAPNTPLKYLTCTYVNVVKKNYWESRIIQVFFFSFKERKTQDSDPNTYLMVSLSPLHFSSPLRNSLRLL